MGYIVTAKDESGQFYSAVYSRRPLRLVKRDFVKGKVFSEDGNQLFYVSAVSNDNHHICKYCKGIAEGADEDLLCMDCQRLFGHSLYSEL